MARDRETVCMHYIAAGQCRKGRKASHKGLCQTCDRYYPRARVRHRNRRTEGLEKIRNREFRRGEE